MRTLPDLRESAQLWVQPTLLAYRRVAAPTHGRKWHTPTALIWFFFVSYRSEAVIGERRARARLGPSLTLSRLSCRFAIAMTDKHHRRMTFERWTIFDGFEAKSATPRTASPEVASMVCDFFRGSANGQAQPVQIIAS